MRRFLPWIGSSYNSGLYGARVLILGESHYGTPPEKEGFTRHIIAKYGQTKRSRFFSVTQRLVSLDKSRNCISSSARKAFWEQVAFYNYVQQFVGASARKRPTPAQWEEAKEPFIHTVRELSPDLIIVLGQDTKRHLPKDLPHAVYAFVRHPSGRGFSYKKWQPMVAAAFEQVTENTQQIAAPDRCSATLHSGR
jgi:hypothetical protein